MKPINSTNEMLTRSLRASTSNSAERKSQAYAEKEPQVTKPTELTNAEMTQAAKPEQVGVQAKSEERKQEENKQVQDAVAKIQEYVQSTERTLDFRIDEDSGQTVVKVLDAQSEKLIRQIPSELALELAQRLNDEEPFSIFTAQV